MMSESYIASLEEEAGKKARRLKLKPRVYTPEMLATLGQRGGCGIPSLGSYRPVGWNCVEDKLCDKTGMGSEREPALTLAGLMKWIAANPTSGFAMVSEGQFQVVVGRFERTT